MSTERKEPLIEMLRTRGLKATPRRLALLHVLAKATTPLSIVEITKRLKPLTLDAATLYRALDALVKVSLVRAVDLRHGHTDYELSYDGSHHHHLVCTSCGKTEDTDYCPSDKTILSVLEASKDFAVLRDHSFEFFGLCRACV